MLIYSKCGGVRKRAWSSDVAGWELRFAKLVGHRGWAMLSRRAILGLSVGRRRDDDEWVGASRRGWAQTWSCVGMEVVSDDDWNRVLGQTCSTNSTPICQIYSRALLCSSRAWSSSVVRTTTRLTWTLNLRLPSPIGETMVPVALPLGQHG